jgi:hypothetical protein
MFQFPSLPTYTYVFTVRSPNSLGGVSPFGHLRIIALAQLPVAFRSATRPSSALDA